MALVPRVRRHQRACFILHRRCSKLPPSLSSAAPLVPRCAASKAQAARPSRAANPGHEPRQGQPQAPRRALSCLMRPAPRRKAPHRVRPAGVRVSLRSMRPAHVAPLRPCSRPPAAPAQLRGSAPRGGTRREAPRAAAANRRKRGSITLGVASCRLRARPGILPVKTLGDEVLSRSGAGHRPNF